MKTAEELHDSLYSSRHGQCEIVTVEELKQIQLDAMKEGMRRAAQIECNKMRMNYLDYCGDYKDAVDDCKKAILTAAEQLTEKDL